MATNNHVADRGMADADSEAGHHEFGTQQCWRCVHAAAMRVERSSTHVRCGLAGGECCGKWSWLGGSETLCPHFSEVTDPARKRMANLAWIISADRKRQLYRPRMRYSHAVEIAECHTPKHPPFPEEV